VGRLKNAAKQFAANVPLIRRLLADRDALRQENGALQQQIAQLTRELKSTRAKFIAASRAQRDMWAPPGHFYSPIPAVSELKLHEAEIFTRPRAIRGVDLCEERQLHLLKELAAFYPEQPFTPQAHPGRRYFFENPNYSYNDAIVLYCMIRHVRPRRIIEIGSGHSSCAMLDVNELFFGNSIACTFIDPYPELLRDLIKDSDLPRVRILARKVQDVSIEVFRELESSDILFIDSSHVTKTGSDVNYIVFKILPSLREGVVVHFHDIFYPFEYPASWVYEGRGWNEAYLLRAFLQYNRAFEIVFFNSFLMENHQDAFEAAMPMCLKVPGANLWLRKIVDDADFDSEEQKVEKRILPAPPTLDVTQPEVAMFLGEGWYEPEPDHCWMTQDAWFQIGAPAASGQKLAIRALSPLANSILSATADGISLGSLKLSASGIVAVEFPLPEVLIGRPAVTVHLAINQIHKAEGDPRRLGLAVNRIEIR
jgi:predicted O-methyltransferase YrrM